MLAWHVPYLGWTRLPADLSEFEITHFFSLRPEERSAVLTRYRDSLRPGALQIGFLKMSGRTLGAVQRVPSDLLKHLGEQIEVPSDARPGRDSIQAPNEMARKYGFRRLFLCDREAR